MPRKRRDTRRRVGFHWDSLTFIDKESVRYGELAKWSLIGKPRAWDRIQTLEDLRQAMRENSDKVGVHR